MIHVAAFSKEKVFVVKPKAMKLRRLYEVEEYSFISGDVNLDCVDSADLRDAITNGEEVQLAVLEDDVYKFRGTFQNEGSGFDPETENYSFSVAHAAKKVSERLKEGKDIFNKIYVPDINLFDYAPFADFMGRDEKYTARDLYVDLAKHYRAVLYVKDQPGPAEFDELKIVPRSQLVKPTLLGYDDYIFSYKEENKNANYDAVFFPCILKIVLDDVSKTYNCFAVYRKNSIAVQLVRRNSYNDQSEGVAAVMIDYHVASFTSATQNELTVELKQFDSEVKPPDECLDLAVPKFDSYKVYGRPFVSGILPVTSLPTFTYECSSGGNAWLSESIKQYCDKNFLESVSPYKEVEVAYRIFMPLSPRDTIAVQGVNLPIFEIEDELVNEETKIICRQYV